MTQTPAQAIDIPTYTTQLAERARAASHKLAVTDGERRAALLLRMADLLVERTPQIIAANQRDIDRAPEFNLTSAMIDRLRLDQSRVEKMALSVRQIAQQKDPVGQIIEGFVRPNGLRIEKTRVPLGVVLFIYESRPNVTSDAAALCINSGNALILRGGKEAFFSNTAIASVIRDTLDEQGFDSAAIQLVETTDRAAVTSLLKQDQYIDVVIPRGGESLIRAVVEQSNIPVIKHYTGNCHVYVDQHAVDLPESMAVDVCVNSKVQRTGVCNAAETFLFHRQATDILRETCRQLASFDVEIRACPTTTQLLSGVLPADKLIPATDEDWATEFLDLIVAIKVVDSIDDAIDHINQYGSRHTDAILTADILAADQFIARVDSADVMVNCSTRFSDGGEYGLGAEIGISTDKLHARGPMGAIDLTTYKWVVRGHGQIRE